MILRDEKYNGGSPELLGASWDELMDLFKTLPAPTMEEMNGEYDRQLLQCPNLMHWLSFRLECDNPFLNGYWVGKAFRPGEGNKSQGYNMFRKWNGKIVQVYPMRTLIAPSRYDGKPAFQLVYRAYVSANAFIHMVDEVRKIDDGHYLLIGTYGFTDKARMLGDFVLLTGPKRPYKGDIGTPMPYSLEKELPRYNDPAKE